MSLFISTLLIAVAIFGICFNSVAFVSNYFQIADDTFDYTLLVPDTEAQSLNSDVLSELANESNVEITDMNEINLLFVGRQHMYGQGNAEWAEEYCVSVSDFNALAGTDLSVKSGSFIYFSDMEETPSFQTLSRQGNNFYLPTSEEFIQMDLQDVISSDAVVNSSSAITEFVIMNDLDYEDMSRTLENDYRYSYYLWNAAGTGNPELFFSAVRDAVVDANAGQYMLNHNTLPVRELMLLDGKNVPQEDVYAQYEGDELDAARNWEFYPFSRATSSSALIETAAVYLLLMFFTAIIGFISATMIIGLRVVNTIWQDETTYKKVEYLGEKRRGLKQLMTQQMSLIFFFPTIIGSLLSILVINRMVDVTSASQHSGIISAIALALSLIAGIMEICVFFALRRKVCKETIG